jgi:death-on-curing family protein
MDRSFRYLCNVIFGLIKNHAFYDANKRTAFLSALYQLYRMGWCPAVSEKQFEDFTVEIAEDKLEKYSRFRESLAQREQDCEVKFIY